MVISGADFIDSLRNEMLAERSGLA